MIGKDIASITTTKVTKAIINFVLAACHPLKVNKSANSRSVSATGMEKWQQQAAALRESLPPTLKDQRPWSPNARMQGLSALPRQQELLDLAYLETKSWLQKQGMDDSHQRVVKSLVADVSQNIGRKPWGPMRTHTTSSMIYSFERDRLVIPAEGLRLLGFPNVARMVQGLSSADTVELVGQAMAVPSVTLAAAALIVGALDTNALPDLVTRSTIDCDYDYGGDSQQAAGS